MSAPLTASDWLRAMYGDDAPGFLILWEKGTKATIAFPATSLTTAGEAAVSIGAAGEVYYGLGLQVQKPTGKGRGGAKSVCALGAVWFDFDIAGPGHTQTNLPQTLDDVKAFAAGLPIPPTALIYSGGGVHAYWFLEKLWHFTTPDERDKAKALSSAWQRIILAKAEAIGWKLDNTADLARVLRLPGTYNRKTEPPRPVSVIEWNGTRYSVAQIEEACGRIQNQNSPQAPKRSRERRPGEAEAHRLLQCPWVAHCRNDAATLPEPEWYGLLTLLATCKDGELAAQEWSVGHPGYSEEATLAKFRHAQDAPAPMSCSGIRDKLNGAPYCNDCKYGDRLGSPMMLTIPAYGLAAEYAYIVDALEFFHHKSRRRLSKEQFSDLHARICSKGNASGAVLQMFNLIRAAGYDYCPGSPTILLDGDNTRINLWINDGATPTDGDPTPFLNHIAYLIPDHDARDHLLNWLAFTVQNPSHRVKHALILSGKQGTGKSYMARVLKVSIRGRPQRSAASEEVRLRDRFGR